MLRFIIFLSAILVIRIALFYGQIDKNENRETSFKNDSSVISEIRRDIREAYLSVLNPKDADLLMGIVFGENLDRSSREKFIETGVLHVVAASGMNVSMLTSFLIGTLVIFLKRQHTLLVTSIIVLFYV